MIDSLQTLGLVCKRALAVIVFENQLNWITNGFAGIVAASLIKTCLRDNQPEIRPSKRRFQSQICFPTFPEASPPSSYPILRANARRLHSDWWLFII